MLTLKVPPFFTLKIADGCLCEVPADEEGALLIPYGEGKSWCAAITGKASKFDRHFWERPRPRREGRYYVVPAYARPGVVLEFGVNHDPPAAPQSPTAAWEAQAISALERHEPKRRRWYGVIAEVSEMTLALAHCKDVAGALAAAIGYEAEPILPSVREQIAGMVRNIRGGAISEAGFLADILDDLSDPRAKHIRDAVRECVDSLFPEFAESNGKSGSLKLKASGSSEPPPF